MKSEGELFLEACREFGYGVLPSLDHDKSIGTIIPARSLKNIRGGNLEVLDILYRTPWRIVGKMSRREAQQIAFRVGLSLPPQPATFYRIEACD